MDGLLREMHLGLGCAVENLLLTAEARGLATALTWMPDPDDTTHVARVDLSAGEVRSSALADAIPFRHTNRGPYLDMPFPTEVEATLRDLVRDDEASLTFLASDEAKDTFRRQTIEATRAIIRDDEMNEASHAWYRHSASAIREHRDGTTLDATGNGSAIRFLGKVSARPSASGAAGYWLDSTRGDQTTGAAFVILSTDDRADRVQQLRCGRAFQRIHLWAAAEGWAIQPLNQMAERQDREQVQALEPTFTRVLRELTGRDGSQMLFRIGVPWEDAGPSPRRPLEWVTR
jgi:nitroreductase